MKSEPESSQSTTPFGFVEDLSERKKTGRKTPKSSLERLIINSENISELLTTKKELKNLRFDELDLLRDIRESCISG